MRIKPFLGYIPDITKAYPDREFAEKLREKFNIYFEQKIFLSPNQSPAYYLLKIIEEKKTSIGLIALVHLKEYTKKFIKKHERTIAGKEKIIQELILERKAMIKPASLIMPENFEIRKWYQRIIKDSKPILNIHFKKPKSQHSLWAIEQQEQMNIIESIFHKKVKIAAIADGHHRFMTMSVLQKQAPNDLKTDHVLAAFFMPQDIRIDTFFRVIKRPSFFNLNDFRLALIKKGIILKKTKRILPSKGSVLLISSEGCHSFKLPIISGISLDLLKFSKLILAPILKIKSKDNQQIKFIEGTKGLKYISEYLRSNKDELVFVFHPLHIQDMIREINKGKLLPAKSTLIMPRIMNGLIISLL